MSLDEVPCCSPSPAPVPLRRRVRFWSQELPHRAQQWCRRHWWPARIRQLDRERADWKRWHDSAASKLLAAVERGDIEDWRG